MPRAVCCPAPHAAALVLCVPFLVGGGADSCVLALRGGAGAVIAKQDGKKLVRGASERDVQGGIAQLLAHLGTEAESSGGGINGGAADGEEQAKASRFEKRSGDTKAGWVPDFDALDLPEPASSGAEDHDCARGQAPSQLAVSSTPRASRGKMQLRAKKLVFKSDDGAVLPKDALGRWDEVPLAHGMCLESLCVSVPFFPVLCFLCMGCTPDGKVSRRYPPWRGRGTALTQQVLDTNPLSMSLVPAQDGKGHVSVYNPMYGLANTSYAVEVPRTLLRTGMVAKSFVRTSGGDIWRDKTLEEWPVNDTRLFIGDLGQHVSDASLTQALRAWKGFNMARVVRNKATGLCRGYGFASFASIEDAQVGSPPPLRNHMLQKRTALHTQGSRTILANVHVSCPGTLRGTDAVCIPAGTHPSPAREQGSCARRWAACSGKTEQLGQENSASASHA